MYWIKSLPPPNPISSDWNYSRFGAAIPSKETKTNTLKKFFSGSSLTEEKLLQAMRDDTRVVIETANDKEARINREAEKKAESIEGKLEAKTVKDDKKRKLSKKIDDFNERKEEAQKTETKDDDKEIAKEEEELMKEIEKEDE